MQPERTIVLPKEEAVSRGVRIQRIASYLSGLDLRAWDVIVRRHKIERTNQQNRYLRGVCTRLLADAIGYEEGEMHEYLCGEHFGWKTEACPKTPNNPRGIKDVPVRTTTTNEEGERDVLNKRDFWDYVEFVQRFGAQHGVVIPDPDPDYQFREWREQQAA